MAGTDSARASDNSGTVSGDDRRPALLFPDSYDVLSRIVNIVATHSRLGLADLYNVDWNLGRVPVH